MKIIFFFFILFFSSLLFADAEIHIGGVEVECVYNAETGATVCERVDNTGDTPGVWNPKTFSCTNFVSPVVGVAGEITCPPVNSVNTPTSTAMPNPSELDVACDPSKGADSGCASQETAIKANDLIAESNSKLGSIASSSATSTGLLSDIASILKGIASQGAPPEAPPPGSDLAGGSGSGAGGGTGSGDSTSDTLLNENKAVGSISVSLSAGSCPAAESFNVLNSSYQLSYQPLCDLASSMRGLVVAIGAFSALLIVVTAL